MPTLVIFQLHFVYRGVLEIGQSSVKIDSV